jgi:hypothetical protein
VSERSPSVCASSRVASGSCVCTYYTSAESVEGVTRAWQMRPYSSLRRARTRESANASTVSPPGLSLHNCTYAISIIYF